MGDPDADRFFDRTWPPRQPDAIAVAFGIINPSTTGKPAKAGGAP